MRLASRRLLKHDGILVFTARRCASAVYAVAPCLCLSVCLSVTSRTSTGIAKRIWQVLVRTLSSISATLSVLLGNSFLYHRKNKVTFLWKGKGPSNGCVCVCSSGRVAPAICVLPFVRNSGLREDFAAASRSRCHQNLSTAELVDHGHDGRRVPAGRAQFICTSVAVIYIHLYSSRKMTALKK